MIASLVPHRLPTAYRLIPLAILTVLPGVTAPIPNPPIPRGAGGAAESGAVSDLSILRSAVELYAAEHDGAFPALATFANQLTLYSDAAGNTNATKTAVFMYGPYLRAIPAQKAGPQKGNTTATGTQGTAGAGWWYTETTGDVRINAGATDKDSNGTPWVNY